MENKTWAKAFRKKSREAPAPFKHRGKYYLLTSGCTGWNPNPAKYAVADHILGPWQDMENAFSKDVARNSWRSQPTFVLPVAGKPNCYIYMGDRWLKDNLRDSRYVWLYDRKGRPNHDLSAQVMESPDIRRSRADANGRRGNRPLHPENEIQILRRTLTSGSFRAALWKRVRNSRPAKKKPNTIFMNNQTMVDPQIT